MKLPTIDQFNKLQLFFLDFFIVFTVVIIPAYSLRISLFFSSLSILSVSCIVLNIILFFEYRTVIRDFLQKDSFLWSSVFLLILSFLPSVIMHPSIHAIGVYIEWICIPACTGLLIAVHLTHNVTSRAMLHYGLLLSLMFVVGISLFYLITGNITYDGRLSSFYLSPNHLALYIAPLIFIPFTIHCYKTCYYNFFSWIILSASLLIIFYTRSFNTILALCLTIATITIFIFKKKLVSFLIIGVLFILICGIGYQKMITGNSSFSHGSLTSRIMIWDVTLFFIQQSPLIGHQIDNFQSHYLNAQRWFSPYPDWAVPTPHNLFFTLLYSGGFFSFFFFILSCAHILFLLYMQYSAHKDTLSIFYITSLLLIIFAGIGDTPYWKNDLSLLFWIFIALASSYCAKNQYILSGFSRTKNK